MHSTLTWHKYTHFTDTCGVYIHVTDTENMYDKTGLLCSQTSALEGEGLILQAVDTSGEEQAGTWKARHRMAECTL